MADVQQRISLPTATFQHGRFYLPSHDPLMASCSSSDERLSINTDGEGNSERHFRHDNFRNGRIVEADFQSREMPYRGPPGFQNMLQFDQIPFPPNGPFGLQQSWPQYPPPIMVGPQGYFNGLPVFNPHHQQMGFINPQPHWQTFEIHSPPQSDQEDIQNGMDEYTHSPWWRPGQYNQQNNRGWDTNSNASSKLGGFVGGYGWKSEFVSQEDKFQSQMAQFTMLPIDIHKKIQNMPGCDITNYFEVTVVCFRFGNIVDRSVCHAIFTNNPGTNQCWLTAFSKKDSRRSVMKFNRLLTSHLNVKVNGRTAIELQPSKASQNRELEEYMINFKDEDSTNEFLHVLHAAKSQIWNHGYAEQCYSGHIVPSQTRFQPMDHNQFGLGFAAGQRSYERMQSQRPAQRSRSDNVVGSRGFLLGKRWTQYDPEETSGYEKNEKKNEGKEINNIMYSEPATLLVKRGDDYAVLGQGEMTIVEHLSYDEIKFFGPNKKLICSHNIYKWCGLEAEENKYICKWFAPVMLSSSPSELPINRHLKMQVDKEDRLVMFCQVFSRCLKKAEKLVSG